MSEDLQKQLEELKKQSEEYLNGWKRAKADLVNLQKQTEKEKETWAFFFRASSILEILPLMDSLESAIKIQKAGDLDKIHQQFIAILKQMGVEEIKALGQALNPEIHEVVGKELASPAAAEPFGAEAPANSAGKKVESYAPGLIIKEVQKGYLLDGKLLRPAKVIVSE